MCDQVNDMNNVVFSPYLMFAITLFLGIIAAAAVVLVVLFFRLMRELHRALAAFHHTSKSVVKSLAEVDVLVETATANVEKSEDVLATFQQAGNIFLGCAQESKSALTQFFNQIAGATDAFRPKDNSSDEEGLSADKES